MRGNGRPRIRGGEDVVEPCVDGEQRGPRRPVSGGRIGMRGVIAAHLERRRAGSEPPDDDEPEERQTRTSLLDRIDSIDAIVRHVGEVDDTFFGHGDARQVSGA